ncbi:MAG: hypothetical protein HQK53_13760, partial [Oligoflexia bacterium]|nr:hypothetical protein [Oligoflexia bacterium]
MLLIPSVRAENTEEMRPQNLFEYTAKECILKSFHSTIEHPIYPLGIIDRKIEVVKDQCIIEIRHSNFKFLKSSWLIDTCKDPVHIKLTSSGIRILKKEEDCLANTERGYFSTTFSTNYCAEVKKINTVIQDDGLIFAIGDKENLNTEYGQIYCSFMLLKKYLEDGTVFSKHLSKNANNYYDSILFPAIGQSS